MTVCHSITSGTYLLLILGVRDGQHARASEFTQARRKLCSFLCQIVKYCVRLIKPFKGSNILFREPNEVHAFMPRDMHCIVYAPRVSNFFKVQNKFMYFGLVFHP